MTKAVGVGDLIDPLDYLILDKLPLEGTLALGVYPKGTLAKDIVPQIAEGQISVEAIAQRLRFMNTLGLTVPQKGLGTSGKNVWQRTSEGEKVLTDWRKRNDSKKN